MFSATIKGVIYMSDKNFSTQKKGRIAENLAQNEFLLHRFDVYASIADDNGVDFIAIDHENKVYYVQVKSVTKGNYTYIRQTKFRFDDSFIVAYVVFEPDYSDPQMYIIRGTSWENSYGGLLKHYSYEGENQSSKPEYGISSGKGHIKTLEEYFSIRNFFELKKGGK